VKTAISMATVEMKKPVCKDFCRETMGNLVKRDERTDD